MLRPSEAELANHAGKTVAGYKKPRRFVFLNDLPRNVNGKIAKEALKSQIGEATKGAHREC